MALAPCARECRGFVAADLPEWDTDPVVELPSGTVTFLFTDVEGSTRLWEEHPVAMQGALARHDEIVRSSVERRGGYVVKTTGDGFHAAFATASDAATAAIDAQLGLAAEPWSATGPLRVRMGLHTGTAEVRDGDYYGPALNRAARLMSAGHGGQIVVSGVTAGLCDGAFALVDLGEHRLRDLSRAERVWQIDLDGERFPPLRSLNNLPGNLPVQLTEFVGRAHEVAAVANALEAHRVVTLTGVGGVGKTRLALQAAAEFSDRFHHGTWFCDLAPIASPDGVVGAIADALGIDTGTAAPDDVLAAALRHHTSLLVVDNCEHVLEEAARIIEKVVRSCPEVSVLATSREGLGAPGEQILVVPSLGVPAADQPVAVMVDAESVRLFVDRARAVRAGLDLDDRTIGAIADICRRLDGIPLAIELAAARMQSMSAAEVDERLDQRFRLLTRGGRAALGRHHTLQTTVDWSYQLLEEGERTVLARSSVFAGGFTLAAAEHVVATDGVDPFEVLDVLGSLVRRSMLVADEIDGTTRYRLLETIRQFGADRLEEGGDAEAARGCAARLVSFVPRRLLFRPAWARRRRLGAPLGTRARQLAYRDRVRDRGGGSRRARRPLRLDPCAAALRDPYRQRVRARRARCAPRDRRTRPHGDRRPALARRVRPVSAGRLRIRDANWTARVGNRRTARVEQARLPMGLRLRRSLFRGRLRDRASSGA